MQTRRTVVGRLLKTRGALAFAPGFEIIAEAKNALPLNLAKAAPVEVQPNFTGLGYEMSSVATPDLLSTANQRYIELVRGLSP